MASARKAKAKPKSALTHTTRRTGRRSATKSHGDEAVPVEYREMLQEVESSEPSHKGDARPLKRRRVGAGSTIVLETSSNDNHIPEASSSPQSNSDSFEDVHPTSKLQTITLDSDDSDESEFEWEDVGLAGEQAVRSDALQPAGVSVVLNSKQNNQGHKSKAKKHTITAAERSMRLDVHKLHICCLLQHNFMRNAYCNDHIAQNILRNLLSSRVQGMLKPDRTFTQMRKASLFMDGLNQVCDLWKLRFTITHAGIRRPHWAASMDELRHFTLSDQVEIALSRIDFREAAQTLRGSADLGAQLLCALLRSAGAAARLVCSFQPLPLVAGGLNQSPQKPTSQKTTVYAIPSNESEDTASDASPETLSRPMVSASPGSPVVPRRIARIGQPRLSVGTAIDLGKAPPDVTRTVHKAARPVYPVYWVEAFNEAQQKWIALDCIATLTVGKPSRLEPPFNDPVNCMSYVIAFEEDGSAKDVTRRYVKAFNAKTRRMRVESTDGGEKWFRKALRLFRRRTVLDRDQVEDAELARKEAAEGMPRNVQDFKNHPYYVLERHLRHNEIIFPMHEVGKVNSGGAASGKLEPVYRRKDVHGVRSADKWYRYGREVKPREQPLKHAKPRKSRNRSPIDIEEDHADNAGVAMYAEFQTELYVPPPVLRGRVPRNAYGNLDVYVPSMVPAGGVHIISSDAAKAAKLVGADYAEAVTGFKFQGRQGTAIVQGVIIAAEYQAAVEEVIEGFQHVREEAVKSKRSAEALRMWRRFMVGLRIIERVQEYNEDRRDGGEQDQDVQEEMDRAEESMDVEGGGGFFFEPDSNAPVEPATVPSSIRSQAQLHLLPDGRELVGFEGVELTPAQRPARRLIALQDNSDEEISKPSAAQRVHPMLSETNFAQTSILGASSSSSHAAEQGELSGGFVTEAVLGGLDDAACFSAEVGGTNDTSFDQPPTLTSKNEPVTTIAQKHVSLSPQVFRNSSGVALERTLDSTEEADILDTIESLETGDDDQGSLLSHDPDDEDAEPDWLEVMSD